LIADCVDNSITYGRSLFSDILVINSETINDADGTITDLGSIEKPV
jgi:hypothetical protein